MSTIFQMNREELVSLLGFLRPSLLFIQPNQHNHSIKATPTNISNFDCVRLRMLITEWLLLNGLSTLHRFERDFDYMDSPLVHPEGQEAVSNGFHRPSDHPPALSISARSRNKEGGELLKDFPTTKWKMPNKMDCISCGKYRVGRSLSIYGKKGANKPPTTIVTEPIPQDYFNELILEENEERKENGTAKNFDSNSICDRQSTKVIKTHHGNLSQVQYYSAKTNGQSNEKTPSNGQCSRSHSFLNNFCLRPSNQTAEISRTESSSVHTKRESKQRQLEDSFNHCPEHKDKCADMCLVCMFCECNAGSKRATRIK